MTWLPEHGERRRQTRFPTNAKARVKCGDKSALCKILNFSTHGLCLEAVGLGIGKGSLIEVRVMLKLGNGTTKIHWRKGTVVWVLGGRAGVSIDSIPQHGPPAYYHKG